MSPRGPLWTSILWSDHPLRQWDYPIEAIWPIAQKVVWQLFCCTSCVCWRSPRACVTAAHTNHTMQVVENGFAPSSDVWGSFWAAGPLFVVKSGLHSITYQMESTRLSGNSQSYWVVSHCDRFTQKYALKDPATIWTTNWLVSKSRRIPEGCLTWHIWPLWREHQPKSITGPNIITYFQK